MEMLMCRTSCITEGLRLAPFSGLGRGPLVARTRPRDVAATAWVIAPRVVDPPSHQSPLAVRTPREPVRRLGDDGEGRSPDERPGSRHEAGRLQGAPDFGLARIDHRDENAGEHAHEGDHD